MQCKRNMDYAGALVNWSAHYPLSLIAKGIILDISHRMKATLNPECSLLFYTDNIEESVQQGLKELRSWNLINFEFNTADDSSYKYEIYIYIKEPYLWKSPGS